MPKLAKPYRARSRTNSYPANLSRPNWMWSARDWDVFRAQATGLTKRMRGLIDDVVSRVRLGEPVRSIARPGALSTTYVYKLLGHRRAARPGSIGSLL